MRFKQEIKDRLYGGHIGIETDKIDFELLKVMLADDHKKIADGKPVTELAWPFGAITALTAVNDNGEVFADKQIDIRYEQVKFKDAIIEEDMQPINANVNEVAEMPSLSVVKVIPAQIEGCNVKHFKEAVKSYLKRYDGIVVTADNYKELSDVVSKLKKEKDNVNESKKAVKKEAMKVYTDFENDMKEVLKMFDASISSLSSDIKEFTDKEVEENKKVVEALCIYLEAKCKESDIDQQMFDLTLYKKMLIQESLESLTKDIDCRINGILRNRELQKQKEEEAKKKEVKQQEPVNASPEENEPLKMLVGKIVGTNSALNELKTSLDYLKAKYDGCFDYDLRFPRKKEGK